MKPKSSLRFAASALLAPIFCMFSTPLAQAADWYWDSDGATAGASSGNTAIGTWGTSAFWSTSSLGDVATTAWTAGNTAVFSAGADATGTYAVTISGTQTTDGLRFEEGIVTLSGGTAVTLNTAGVHVASGATGIISTGLGGTAGLTKTGAGTLQLLGINKALTGTITVNEGILDLRPNVNNANVFATAPELVLGGGTVKTTRVAAINTVPSFSGITLNAGSSTAEADHAASNNGTALTLGGITRNVGGTLNVIDDNDAEYVRSSTGNTNGIMGGYATFNGSSWAVGLSGGTYGNDIAGLASYATTAASTDTANVDVTTSTLGSSAANSLRFNGASAKTLTLNGATTITSGGILVASTVGNNASVITGGTSLAGAANKDLIVHQNNTLNTLTIASTIVDNGLATGLTKSGAGTLIVTSATNGYTGATYINTGTLEVGSAGTLGSGSYAGEISNKGTFRYNSSAAQTLSGVVSGTGTLVKDGAGTLTLTNNSNTYTGNTTVNTGGALVVNGNISTSALTTVNTGGTIAGSGTVGMLTVASGGTLSPGSGTLDSLDIAGNLTLADGSFSAFGINTVGDLSDLAIASALLTFDGTLNVTNVGGTLVSGDVFNLFDWNTTSGSFDAVNLPSLSSGLTWNTSNLYTNGTIAVVPEPAAALLGGLGLLGLLRRRRN